MSNIYSGQAFVSNRQSSGAIFRRSEISSSYRRNQNTVKFAAGTKLGPVSHTIFVVIMLVILGMIYLTQITKTGTYGYELSNLEAKRNELLSKKQDLEVENARLQALSQIQESSVAKALTNPVSEEYAQN